jgi:hypothetical protein
VSSSEESDNADEGSDGNVTDDTKYSGEVGRSGSVWSAISDGSGILKTTTIEVKEEVTESLGSSTRSSVVPKEWKEALQSKADVEPSGLLSMIVE